MNNYKGWRPESCVVGIYVEPHAVEQMHKRFPDFSRHDFTTTVRAIQSMIYNGFWHGMNKNNSWLVEAIEKFSSEIVYLRCEWDSDGKVRVKTTMNKDQCQVFPD